jgi:hypothetical protein
LADCSAPEAEVHEAVVDADGEVGVLGDLADSSPPEAEAHEDVLDADGEEGVLGDLANGNVPEANALEAVLDADGEEGGCSPPRDAWARANFCWRRRSPRRPSLSSSSRVEATPPSISQRVGVVLPSCDAALKACSSTEEKLCTAATHESPTLSGQWCRLDSGS